MTLSAKRRVVLGVLAVISMIGIGAYLLGGLSLRLDEAQSLYQASRDIPGLLKLVAEDVHVPLYHILLHGWLEVVGNTVRNARILSLLFFVGTIGGTYLLGNYAFKRRKVGLFAAAIVALSPFTNWYGSETRMYTMLAFMTVFSQLFFLRLLYERKTSDWLMYTLFAILGIYTHYFFSFVLFTQALYLGIKRHELEQLGRTFHRLVLSAAATIAAFAPWLLYVQQLGSASNTKPSLTAPSSIDLVNTYSNFLFGFQTNMVNTILVSLWPIVVLLAFLAIQKRRKATSEALFFVLAAILPVVGAFVISRVTQPLFLSRYLIVAFPALSIFISWVFSLYPRKVTQVAQVALIIVITGASVVQTINPNTPVKEDYSQVSQYLSSQSDYDDIVIVSAPFTIYPLEYYYRGRAPITTLPNWNRFEQGSIPAFDKSKLTAESKQANGSAQRAWLVLSFDQGYQEDIKDYYDSNYQLVTSRQFSEGLHLYEYQLRYDDLVTL